MPGMGASVKVTSWVRGEGTASPFVPVFNSLSFVVHQSWVTLTSDYSTLDLVSLINISDLNLLRNHNQLSPLSSDPPMGTKLGTVGMWRFHFNYSVTLL